MSKDEGENSSMQYNVTSRPVRSTAGNRYAKLLQGELEKQKDDFYQETYGGFNEEENDNDFDGAGLEDDDVLDSDFNTSGEGEGDDEGEGSDPDVDPERKKRKTKRVVTRAYKEPKRLKTAEDAPKPRAKEIGPTVSSEKTPIELRRSTTEKRNTLLESREDSVTTQGNKRSRRKVQQMTQEERLREAEKMEVINKESLEKFLKLEEEKKKKREPKKADKGPQIRFKSYLSYDGATGDEIDNELSREADLTQGTRDRKVSRNLIVFPDSTTFEQTFRMLAPTRAAATMPSEDDKSSIKGLNKSGGGSSTIGVEAKKRLICPITRQPARYFDPLTQQPYSSMSAFKVLRQIYKLKLSILHSTDQISADG